MGFRGNQVLLSNHFRKDWQRRVKTWFDQPGRKLRRRQARATKAAVTGAKPLTLLRPAVRAPTVKYNMKLRAGRGFSLAELKEAKLGRRQARVLGIPVDHRRRNKSQEGLDLNVARIAAYRERLIVLPRNPAKPRKGETVLGEGESTLAHTHGAFPIPAGVPHEAPRAVTSAEKEQMGKNYAALRTARADVRYAGARKARREKKEAEEEAKKK